jgi:hypothetical protein
MAQGRGHVNRGVPRHVFSPRIWHLQVLDGGEAAWLLLCRFLANSNLRTQHLEQQQPLDSAPGRAGRGEAMEGQVCF